MIRLALGAAALLLSACMTAPYGQPYGQDPYGEPYPGGAYPPPSYPPDQYAPAPPMAACPIVSSRDWRAWINAMPGPGARPKLMLTGTVVMPSGGNQLAFEPHLAVREVYPAQAVATLRITPPQGPATQALTTHDLRWEWPLAQPIGSVEVRCGDRTLATISPVETAH